MMSTPLSPLSLTETRQGSLTRALLLFALLPLSCRQEEVPVVDLSEPASSTAPSAASPDRLPPGRLLEGTEQAFGLHIPKEMSLQAHFSDSAQAVGRVSADDLLEYIQHRILARHVEMAPGKWIFPQAHIKGGDQRLLRIEIDQRGPDTRLYLRDITPPPPVEGLSEAERWRRAGLTPEGRLIDPQNLE